eukprot:scaffold659729_cov134-Prasinocladus_malaysianus.AAC.1
MIVTHVEDLTRPADSLRRAEAPGLTQESHLLAALLMRAYAKSMAILCFDQFAAVDHLMFLQHLLLPPLAR